MAATKPKPRKTSKGVQLPRTGLAARLAFVEQSMLRTDLPNFKPGDTVRVHVKIKEGEKERIQAYEGVCISRCNAGASKSFTVRKLSHGVGVERTFLDSCPKVAKIDLIQAGRVRRAKLYYLRELEGKAAKIEREVETIAQSTASAAAKAKAKAKAAATK